MKIKLTRIIGMLTAVALFTVALGLLLKSEKGYAYILEGGRILESRLLEKKIPQTEKNILLMYQEIGRRVSETVCRENEGAGKIDIDHDLSRILFELRDCRRNLQKMKMRLAALPGLMNKKMAFHSAVANLRHKDRFIREEAVKLLENIGGLEALPYLVEMINDTQTGPRAADAIVQIINRSSHSENTQMKKLCLEE